MKTTRSFFTALAVGLLLSSPIPRALALTVTEPPDFANDAASAATYVLDVGSHLFSGQISFASGDADFFKITIQPGRKVSAVVTNGASGISVPAAPVFAGTYTVSCVPGAVISDVNWSITFTVAAAPDYEVSTTGGQIVVTDRSGNSDTLTVSEPFAGTIQFAATGRNFSINGAAFTPGDSGAIAHGLSSSITVNAGDGGDTINVGAFTSELPSLAINGGIGDDMVNLQGDLDFLPAGNLAIAESDNGMPTTETVNVAAGANVRVTGTSAGNSIVIDCARNLSIATGGSLESTSGGYVTLSANRQAVPLTGNFTGVRVSGGTIASVSGRVTVSGRGGNASGGAQLGVEVTNGGKITTTAFAGTISVTGTGGDSSGTLNRGVTVSGAGSEIRASAGSVSVSGTGGPSGSYYGIGVSVLAGGVIAGGNSGASVAVTGTGAGAGGFNMGVELGAATITAAGAHVIVTGRPGAGSDSLGVFINNASAVLSPGRDIEIRTRSFAIDATSNITATLSRVTFGSDVGPLVIDLGGENAPGRLGLSDAKLDRVFTNELSFQNLGPGTIEITAPITRATATNLRLFTSSGVIRGLAAGTDLSLAGGTLTLFANLSSNESPLAMPITGASADTGYPRLSLAGSVDLNFRKLDLTGTTFAGVPGSTFTIVENDGTDPITDIFSGLPEGATLAWPGSSLVNARITYNGGSGNDAVLTLVSALEVTNAADSGLGSLPDVLTYAAAKPGADTVTFHPSLSGATILLDTEIVIDDPAAVTVDASSLPAVVTIGGGPGSNRLFSVSSGKSLALLGLRLIGGNGGGVAQNGNGNAIANFGTLALTRCTLTANTRPSGSGGAILNDGGTLTLAQCTLSGNSTTNGGAIFQTTGSMTLTQCTLAANTAATNGDGGAIYKQGGTAALTHCTLSGNHAALSGGDGGAINQLLGTLVLTHCTVSGNEAEKGGGISNLDGTTTLTHSIVAGNTAPGDGQDIRIQEGSITGVGQNIVQGIAISGGNVGGNFLNAQPLLAPLGDYGGPTHTMALQPGSPAREAATTSTSTSDQRGVPTVGTPDIGAYETGIPRNYAAWHYETLPAAATLAERAPGVDFDGDGRVNLLEYATFPDGSVPGFSTGDTFIRLPDGTEARFTFFMRFNATDLLYEVQRSLPGVGPWVTVGDVNLRTGTIHNYGVGVTNALSPFSVGGITSIEFRDPGIAGQGKAFYRLQVSVP